MSMHDDEPHEIQLHGKQLVFVVMTATVVAVAIFLCGVLVGRGVPAPRPDGAVEAELTADPLVAETVSADTVSADVASSAADLAADAPPTAAPSYGPLLEAPDPVQETLERPRRPVSEDASVVPAPVRAAPARLEGARSSSASAGRLPAATNRDGFVVQVSAVKGRAEAETIRRRLAGKGYAAFVEPVGSGERALYRVRVGHYESRSAAQAIAARLEREERFKTWITR